MAPYQGEAFGHYLKGLFVRDGRSQKEIASACDINQGNLSHALRGRRRLTIGQLRLLANELKISFDQIFRKLIECEVELAETELKKKGWLAILEDLTSYPLSVTAPRGEHLTLQDWPCLSLELIAGDRRDVPPKDLADILALPASIGDLFFLSELKTPIRIWFDKLVKAGKAKPSSLRRDLIVVGSPAVNLAARSVNSASFFRFRVDPVAQEHENEFEKEISELGTESENGALVFSTVDLEVYLKRLTDQHPKKLDTMLNLFRGNGFEDPFDRVSAYGDAKQHGLISLAANPWSDEHLAILVGGEKGAATAAGIRLLAQLERFEDHPLGGIYQVEVPKKAVREDWANLKPDWVTKAYTIAECEEEIREQANQEWLPMLDLLKLLKTRASRLQMGSRSS